MNLYLAFDPRRRLVAYLFTKVPYHKVLVPSGVDAACFSACHHILYSPGIEVDVWHLVESTGNCVLAEFEE